MRLAGFVLTVAFMAGGTLSSAGTETPDEQALKAAFQATDGPALLTFFHTRTVGHAEPAKLRALVTQLSDPAAGDNAARELVALGPVAIPWLRQAAKDVDDSATAPRAAHCLHALEGSSGANVPASAARLLALAKPAGAAEALLAYLPFADDDSVVGEVQTALTALAFRDGKPDDVLVHALGDPLPLRRQVAAEVLCQAGGSAEANRVRKLLHDPKPTVRLRVALALLQLRDVEAVPALITLIGDLPVSQGRQADDALRAVAAELCPNGARG